MFRTSRILHPCDERSLRTSITLASIADSSVLNEEDPATGPANVHRIGECGRPAPSIMRNEKERRLDAPFGDTVGTFRRREHKPNDLFAVRLVELSYSLVSHDSTSEIKCLYATPLKRCRPAESNRGAITQWNARKERLAAVAQRDNQYGRIRRWPSSLISSAAFRPDAAFCPELTRTGIGLRQ